MPNDSKRTKGPRRSGRGGRQFPAGKPSRPSADASNANTLAHAKRSYERYIALARDAASAGDAIESENYYQHAEHYLRTMREHGDGRGADERAGASKGVPAS
jgi:Domain of unknown function (DUF4167)